MSCAAGYAAIVCGHYALAHERTRWLLRGGKREASGLLHDGLAPGTSRQALVAEYNKAPVRNVHMCRRELHLSEQEQEALVTFVRQALTDPRAAKEAAPSSLHHGAEEGDSLTQYRILWNLLAEGHPVVVNYKT